MTIRHFVFILIIGIMRLAAPSSLFAADGNYPVHHSLWYTVPPPPASESQPEPKHPWVMRDRDIALNSQLFHVFKDAAARPHPRITIELFDGVRYDLDITSTVSRIDGTSIIKGTFKSPAQGTFSFVATENLLVGTMHVGHRLYKTEHVANGRLRLLEVDPARMPPD